MIDLKRNSKKELVVATGKRVMARSIYTPGQVDDFKISRGKFSDFLSCPRCFYFDRVKGFESPGTPGWTLNETTDLLLKKEFDECRSKGEPHRLFVENELEHLIPFDHADMDKWRDSLRHGLMSRFEDTNIILSGGVDDIWLNTKTEELVVADYKSQANSKELEPSSYLSDPFHEGYKVQLDFYAYLLKQMGFGVDPTAYFLVCNADRSGEGFYGVMRFSETLIPYTWNDEWLPEKIDEMIAVLNSPNPPQANPSCKNCAYARQRSLYDRIEV